MIELAGDESGSDGENLSNATHRFFTYGSTDLTTEESVELIHDIRVAIGSTEADVLTAKELKSSPLLKKHRLVVADVLRAGGPLDGRVGIYVVDKYFFLAGKMISLFVEEEAHERGVVLGAMERKLAVELHDEVAPRLGNTWVELIHSFNRLVRFFHDDSRSETPHGFIEVLDQARQKDAESGGSTAMKMLWSSRRQAYHFDSDSENTSTFRNLEPLIPVLFAVASNWTERRPGQAIRLTADQHSALVPEVLDLIVRVSPVFQSQLASVVQDDSKLDPRLQVADLVAGAGQYAASMIQDGRSDLLTNAAVRHFDDDGIWSEASPLQAAIDGRA